MVLGYDLRRKDLDYGLLRKLAGQWRESAAYYYGDYYPLTPYSREEDHWIAWQFHRSEQGDGIVEAFRRGRCDQPAILLRLSGLDAAARYQVADLDSGVSRIATGKELMESGLPVEIKSKPGAAAIVYQREK